MKFLILFLAATATSSLSGHAFAQNNETEKSIAAFQYVYKTVMNRRCTNCHSTGGPRQFENGSPHNMNINRSITELGYRCTSCHQSKNFDQPHMPPGAEDWRMPSDIKAFDLSTSAEELCRLWLDPQRNATEPGGVPRTPAQLLAHVATDPRVIWAWDPGPGRKPISTSRDEFLKQFAIWVNTGAHCP